MTARVRRAQGTKPTQAGSSRSLDRWQREVEACIALIVTHAVVRAHAIGCGPGKTCMGCELERRLTRLLASMRKAESR